MFNNNYSPTISFDLILKRHNIIQYDVTKRQIDIILILYWHIDKNKKLSKNSNSPLMRCII